MPLVDKRNVLSGIRVREAMRRQVVQLRHNTSIDYGINRMIKYKINSVLLIDEKSQPIGVVSKTDIMSAFYAGFDINTPLDSIMVGPPQLCYPDDELESSLDLMNSNGIHRLYVLGADYNEVAGVLSYPDIVGLLYRYCRACDKGLFKVKRQREEGQFFRLQVKDVMTHSVAAYRENEKLVKIIEGLTTHHHGAVLIRNVQDKAVGVVSKTDLIIAYKHGIVVDVKASSVMSTPVKSCDAEAYLAAAIQQMLVTDVQRIFVYSGDPSEIIGVLSLSDAASVRSGSCRACTSSRLMHK